MNDNISNECIICFENEIDSQCVISLRDITSLSGECNCNAYIHSSCYAEWVSVNKSCPICREPLEYVNEELNNSITPLVERETTRHNSYIYICTLPFILLVITFISYIFFESN